jgi:hydroxymethylpyrimidine pyrophosphatase-like HAD family hydrolase
VADVAEHLEKVAKIVGVSDDLERVRGCEADARASFGDRVTAARSQPYYLDITNKLANKGEVVEFLSAHVGVPAEEIATIGDADIAYDQMGRCSESDAIAPDRARERRKPSRGWQLVADKRNARCFTM